MGKGLTGSHNPQTKPCPDMQGRDNKANLTAGDSLGAVLIGVLRKRGCLKSPARYYGTPGSVRRGGKLPPLPGQPASNCANRRSRLYRELVETTGDYPRCRFSMT